MEATITVSRLKKLRDKIDEMRLEDIGKLAGVGRSHISLILRGRRALHLSKATQLAKGLNCSLGDLVEVLGTIEKTPSERKRGVREGRAA
jgi:transcriptional regulator with XRE-family HTH domain